MEEEKVSYQEFLHLCIVELKEKFGEEFNIQLNSVLKNNSITMDGVVILKNGTRVSPNIYLNDYYGQYEQGTAIQAIVSHITKIYYEKLGEKEDIRIDFSYEKMRELIIYRLVNYEKNKELIKNCPHLRFLDLAATFHCLVQEKDDTIGTIRITDEHLQLWNIDEKTLVKQAKLNTPKLLPPIIRRMEDVLQELCMKQREDQSILLEEMHQEPLNFDIDIEDGQGLYVLSNNRGINGASCLLYDNLIRNFAMFLQKNIYILPSSIHELILLPDQEDLDLEQLKRMVVEINQTQVPYEEILSDHVYKYSYNDNKIIVL